MAQRIRILTPNGPMEYPVYNDNREMVADFQSGRLKLGDEVIYRGDVCEVLYEFTDVDGVKYMELLVKGGMGGNIQFQIL